MVLTITPKKKTFGQIILDQTSYVQRLNQDNAALEAATLSTESLSGNNVNDFQDFVTKLAAAADVSVPLPAGRLEDVIAGTEYVQELTREHEARKRHLFEDRAYSAELGVEPSTLKQFADIAKKVVYFVEDPKLWEVRTNGTQVTKNLPIRAEDLIRLLSLNSELYQSNAQLQKAWLGLADYLQASILPELSMLITSGVRANTEDDTIHSLTLMKEAAIIPRILRARDKREHRKSEKDEYYTGVEEMIKDIPFPELSNEDLREMLTEHLGILVHTDPSQQVVGEMFTPAELQAISAVVMSNDGVATPEYLFFKAVYDLNGLVGKTTYNYPAQSGRLLTEALTQDERLVEPAVELAKHYLQRAEEGESVAGVLAKVPLRAIVDTVPNKIAEILTQEELLVPLAIRVAEEYHTIGKKDSAISTLNGVEVAIGNNVRKLLVLSTAYCHIKEQDRSNQCYARAVIEPMAREMDEAFTRYNRTNFAKHVGYLLRRDFAGERRLTTEQADRLMVEVGKGLIIKDQEKADGFYKTLRAAFEMTDTKI